MLWRVRNMNSLNVLSRSGSENLSWNLTGFCDDALVAFSASWCRTDPLLLEWAPLLTLASSVLWRTSFVCLFSSLLCGGSGLTLAIVVSSQLWLKTKTYTCNFSKQFYSVDTPQENFWGFFSGTESSLLKWDPGQLFQFMFVSIQNHKGTGKIIFCHLLKASGVNAASKGNKLQSLCKTIGLVRSI